MSFGPKMIGDRTKGRLATFYIALAMCPSSSLMHGFRERTYGMPMLALCANISWEIIFSFVFPSSGIQRPVNIIWFFLDVIILATFLLYGPGEFASLPRRTFFAMFGLTLITSFCAVLFITLEFHDRGTYSAFGQNLMMSVLFILMLSRRHALRGQSGCARILCPT